MKKLLVALMAVFMATFCVTNVFAGTSVEVYLDGEKQNFTVQVEEIGGHTLVPLRAMLEMQGYSVRWDGERNWVYCTSAMGKFLIVMGLNVAMNNNYNGPYTLSTYPRLLNGTTVIPKDFAEALTGTSIIYEEATNSLMVLTGSGDDSGLTLEGVGGYNK